MCNSPLSLLIRLSLIAFAALLPFTCNAQKVSVSEVAALGLPVVVIETVGHEEPTYDNADAPPGAFGDAITNATKVPGEGYIIIGDSITWRSGAYEADVSGLTIKIRGNSSARQPKKPYKLKLQRKADLIEGDATYNDTEWLLVKNDTTSFNMQVGLAMSRLIGMPWTPRGRLVNVIINEDYRGLYTLVECVERNTSARVDVEKNKGYIFEWDAYWWNEPFYLKDSHGCLFTFKYPKPEKLESGEAEYIQAYVDSTELAIDEGRYGEYIDVPSFANYLLAHDILGTYDGAGSNTFLTKYDNTPTSPIQILTLWDFDTIMQQFKGWSGIHYAREFWFPRLLDNQDKRFLWTYIDRWDEVKDTLFQQMDDWLEAYERSEEFQGAARSWSWDLARYGKDFPTAQEQMERARNWFRTRSAHIEEAITPYRLRADASLSESADATDDILYDLQGRRLTGKQPKGVIITGGRKVFLR